MAITAGTAALLGGSTLLSGVLGGLFSSSSQESANKTNLQVARETNALNERMFHESQAWQEDMWNKTNAYNSPENQVKLLTKAGINPAAVYGTGSTSDASLPSSPSAPQMQPGHVEPIDYSWLGNSIDSGINAFFNNQILNNQVEKGKYDAQLSKISAEESLRGLEYRCMKTMYDSQASEFAKEQAKLTLDTLRQTQKDTITQAQWQSKIMEQQYNETVNKIALSKLQQRSLQIANEYAPQLNDAQLRQYKAGIANLFASARNQDAQALESGARKLLVDVQKEGARISNEQADLMVDAVVHEAIYRADQAYWNAQESAKTFRLGKRLGDITPGNNVRTGGKSYTKYNSYPAHSNRRRSR